jgi:uncharacterized protein (DUF4213/DUF364 family)
MGGETAGGEDHATLKAIGLVEAMNICERLYESMAGRAAETSVEVLSIGLGYTAVSTADGGLGLAFTSFESKKGCTVVNHEKDYEDSPALDLLRLITAPNPIHRSMALALVNALNHRRALELPEDRSNETLFDLLGIGRGTRVAMAGYFGTLIAKLEKRAAVVELFDIDRRIGDSRMFLGKLGRWAEVLIMTSTAILNDTADSLLAAVGPDVQVVMMGPSTPLVADAFIGLPVDVLAGTVPVDSDGIFKAVRHGKGNPVLQRFSRKSHLLLSDLSDAVKD